MEGIPLALDAERSRMLELFVIGNLECTFNSHEAITFFVTFYIFLIRITLKTMVKLLNHMFLKLFIVIQK